MKRFVAAVALSALVLGSCSSSGSEPESTGSADSTPVEAVTTEPQTAEPQTTETSANNSATTEPESTGPSTTDSATTVLDATDSETTETTEPVVAVSSQADLAITEIVFDEHVTITNLGASAIDLNGVWLCNRPSYVPLPNQVLEPGASVDLTDLPTSTNGGEAALYMSNNFADSSAILDYVAWGTGGGRASVASGAGVWPEGETVDAAGGVSISAPAGGAAPVDWSE